jgi:hypothetical protein
MAENMFRKYTEAKTEEWVVAAGTKSGTLVLHTVDTDRVGVTLTGRGDVTKSQVNPDGTILSGIPDGGIGNKPTAATVAVDGSFLFPVAGVTAGETVAGTGTPQGTSVYREADGDLVLVGTNNTYVGKVDDGNIVGTRTPILIGVPA